MGGKSVEEPESSRLLADIAREQYERTNILRNAGIWGSTQDQVALNREAMRGDAPWQQGRPLTNQLFDRSNRFLQGGLDVTASPMWGQVRRGIDQEYGDARRIILENTPRGGALTASLTDAALGRAGALAQARGNLAQQELNRAQQMMGLGLSDRSDAQNRALQLASMGLGQGTGGLAQSAAMQNQAMQTQAGQSAAKGQTAGMLAAAAMMASDCRVKRNIRRVGEVAGVAIYRWQYVWGGPEHVGVMAQEVPWAAVEGPGGILLVDYSRVW